MKIMIVDDHPAMRRILRWIVDSSIYREKEFMECEDGDETVIQYSQFHPDIVLMDIQLQEMNGFTAAEKIMSQDPNAKIIFVTSHDTQAHRSKAEKLHATAFVSKENLTELHQILHNIT